MSGMLPDGIGAQLVAVTLNRTEWGVVIAALYEAALPLKLSGPVVNKVQTQLAPQQSAPAREETP